MRYFSWCVFAMLAAQPSLFAEVQFEGDRALLDVLRSAQQTHSVAGTRGRLVATVDTDFKVRAERQYYKMLMIWDNDRMYWEYDSTIEKRGHVDSRIGLRQLETPSVRICYLPNEKRMVSWPAKTQSIPDSLLIRPSDCWYHFGTDRSWLEIFDPTFLLSDVKVVRVQREGADNVVFERIYHAGIYFKVVCSLKHGANVIHYETTPAVNLPSSAKNLPNPIRQGDYSWTDDGKSGFRLEKFTQSESDASAPREPYWKRTIIVHEFDAEYVPSATQFTIDALGIKSGTLVDEYSPGHRSYLYGVRPTATVQDELDSLLKRLPQAGFPSAIRGK